MMGIKNAEAEIMFFCISWFLKLIGVKQTISWMIVKESGSILITIYFKYQISFSCGLCIKFVHQVNIRDLRIMIYKQFGSNISCHRCIHFVSCYTARSCAHKLINANKLTTFCWRFNLILTGNLPGFATSRTTVVFSINKTCTSVGIYIIEISWNESCPGQ